MLNPDDEKWEIPEKWRASIDISDEAAHALLVENDKAQAELSKHANSPFSRANPRILFRSKAYTAIETLLHVQQFQPLTADQKDQLAEAYALIGRYDLAAQTAKAHKKLYLKYWQAVFEQDANWCPHGAKHQYVKEHIWSIREQKEVPLLACNVCGNWNAAEASPALQKRVQSHSAHQGRTQGMTIEAARAYHQHHVKQG